MLHDAQTNDLHNATQEHEEKHAIFDKKEKEFNEGALQIYQNLARKHGKDIELQELLVTKF